MPDWVDVCTSASHLVEKFNTPALRLIQNGGDIWNVLSSDILLSYT